MAERKRAPSIGRAPADESLKLTSGRGKRRLRRRGYELTLAYSLAFAALAGYLAARLPRGAERRSVPVLAGAMLLLTLGSVVQLWDTAPAWYHVASLLLLAPAVLLGGAARAATLRAA